jgi:PAS domain S-box-containing protein
MIGLGAAIAGRRVWRGMGDSDNSPLEEAVGAAGAVGAADNSWGAPGAATDPGARELRGKSVLLLALNAALIGWILLSPAQGLALRLPIAAATVLASLVAVAWSLPPALRLWRGRWRDGWRGLFGRGAAADDAARRCSAVAFTLAFAAILSGQVACYRYEIFGQQAPFPSLADAGYLLAYPFLIAAVLLLPARRLTGVQRGRVLMDSCMTLAAAATFSWYFLLGPTLLASSQTALQKCLAAGYPVGDLLVLFCLLLTVARVRGEEPARGMLPLCMGLLVIIVTDVVYGYQSLHGAYVPGTAVDAGWPLGFMLLALGARGVLLGKNCSGASDAAAHGEVVASGVETMLPYALVPMVGALVLATLEERNAALVAGVYVGSAVIVLLVVLRQVLTIRKNARLYGELSRAYGQLEQSHRSLEAANATLAQTEERFRAAAESASDLIYEVDFDTGGVEWFGDVSRHLAAAVGEFPRTMDAWEDLIHPDDCAHVMEVFRRHVETGERYEIEYRVRAGDGQYRHWLARGLVTRRDSAGPRRAVGAVSDVTERKRAEALEGERAGLRQAVSAMEGVLGVVGHELRTPLAGLRAMSEFLLTDGVVGGSDCQQMLSGINEEVVRMSETVNDLLEAARLNSGLAKWKWSTFSLRRACEEAIEPIQALVDETAVALACDVEQDLEIRGDADAVRRLVLNLLSNARKHTKQGSIRVSAVERVEAGQRWVEILVSDTGAGIPPEIRDRLGEAFALNAGMVGANHVNGTGLGLAICKGIATAHGGRLVIRSELGAGTTVAAKLRADLPGPTVEQGKALVTGLRSRTATSPGE